MAFDDGQCWEYSENVYVLLSCRDVSIKTDNLQSSFTSFPIRWFWDFGTDEELSPPSIRVNFINERRFPRVYLIFDSFHFNSLAFFANSRWKFSHRTSFYQFRSVDLDSVEAVKKGRHRLETWIKMVKRAPKLFIMFNIPTLSPIESFQLREHKFLSFFDCNYWVLLVDGRDGNKQTQLKRLWGIIETENGKIKNENQKINNKNFSLISLCHFSPPCPHPRRFVFIFYSAQLNIFKSFSLPFNLLSTSPRGWSCCVWLLPRLPLPSWSQQSWKSRRVKLKGRNCMRKKFFVV